MTSVISRRLGRALPLVVVLAACTGGDEQDVEIAEVGRADVDEVVQAPATVQPRAAVTMRAADDGRIAELNVGDGDKVEAGDVLARIESPNAARRLREAREAHQRAAGGQVTLPQAGGDGLATLRQQADRAARDGFQAAREAAAAIPDQERRAEALAALAESEARYEAAHAAAQEAIDRFNQGVGSLSNALSSLTEAQLVQTRAALRAAERTVQQLTITAPIDGLVSLGGPAGGGSGSLGDLASQLPPEIRDQAVGAAGGAGGPAGGATTATQIAEGVPVSAGDAVLTVTDTSSLSLVAEVDETDVLQVEPGVEADVEFDAVPGADYAGKVRSVDVSARESSGGGVKYRVRLSLRGGTAADGSPAPRPKPGMSAIAQLRVRHAEDAVAVPASAVVYAGEQTTVWVVGDGIAERRTVRIGAEGASMVEITSGLRVGERVVVRGADTVDAGDRLP